MKSIWTEKTEGKTAFQHGFILECKWCEQHQASLCHFRLPSLGLPLFSGQAPLHHLLVCSSAPENSDVMLVPAPWYVIYFIPLVHVQWFSSVQLLSRVWLFATPWIEACQASLSITNSQSLPKLMSIKSVMPSSHLILCPPLLLLPPIPHTLQSY